MSRRLAIWLALLLVFAVLVALAAASATESSTDLDAPISRDGVSYTGTVVQRGDSGKQVAMVPIVGTVTSGDSAPDGSSTGGDDVVRMLDEIADEKDRWDGVILELDTPGGAVIASEEMHAAILRVKKAGIPVVAWMRDVAASAGFYVAAPADRIVAANTTFTGSIGVILQYQELEELADKVGVRSVVIKSAELKDIGSPFRRITAAEREVLQSIIDEAYAQFVDVVQEGRDLSEDEVLELADGRPYTGRQAERLGLVDELGLRRTAFAAMAKEIGVGRDDGDELEVVRFNRSFSIFESLGAEAEPTLAGLRTAGAIGSLLSGDASASTRLGVGAPTRAGNGLVQLEYRAQL